MKILWVLGLAVTLSCRPADPLERLYSIVARDDRLFEGRLAHGEFGDRRRVAEIDAVAPRAPASRAILRIAGQIERQARQLPAGEAARRRGIVRLALARYDAAVRELEAAGAHLPVDPSTFNDLAVAYLARHRHTDRPFDAIQALVAGQRALRLAPESKTASFNRALALSRLHLRRQAAAAWRDVLAVEDNPQERADVKARLRNVSTPDELSVWKSRQRALERGEVTDVRSLVEVFPYRSRRYVEEQLLGEWARAKAAGASETAESSLEIARAIAEALSELRREYLLLEAVAVIDETSRRGSDDAKAGLIQGHLDFASGMVHYYRQELQSAQQRLIAAARGLRRAGSPIAGWARFYLAICNYYSDADRAIAEFRALLDATDPERHPSLCGRLHWLLGTAAGAQERFQEGLDHFEQALELLSRSSGDAGSAFLHVLFAEVLDPLGEIEQGWAHRLRSLAVLSGSGDHRRIHSMLNEAAQALLRQGLPSAAQPFLEELVANALDWPDHPFALAEALAQRSEGWLGVGRHGRALDDLRASREVLARVETSGLTRQLENWLDVYEALALEVEDPAHTVELLTRAFAAQDAAGYDFERPRFLADRARALLAIGREDAAVADLLKVIEDYEQIHDDIAESSIRLRFFRQAQPAFDQLIALQVRDAAGDDGLALATAERARSRFLRQQRSTAGRGPPPVEMRLEEIRRRWPRGVTAIEFAFLPTEILAWVIDRESVRLVRLTQYESDVVTMRGRIQRLRRDLERQASEETIVQSASDLFERLIAPLELPWETLKLLLIVPDRQLSEIPFTALFDGDVQQYLVERVPVAITPALGLLQPLSRPDPAIRDSVLVVGDPDLSESPYRNLPLLLRSSDEALRVARLYGAESLVGRTATRRNVLDSLPRTRLMHFAGHAVANSERPERSFLPLTPEEGEEPVLTARDLWIHDLEGLDLVVLSACGTMAGLGEGREALFGLAGGFFAAGAREIVATLWPADDEHSADVMVRFHERYLETRNAAGALREAILDLRRSAPHGAGAPSHWAAFSVLTSSLQVSKSKPATLSKKEDDHAIRVGADVDRTLYLADQ